MLPTIAEAFVSLSADSIAELERLNDKQKSPQSSFNLAWGLIRSSTSDDQHKGIELLLSISKDNPNRRKECLYYIGLAHYKLGNYRQAREYTQSLLQIDHSNQEALMLNRAINEKVHSGMY